MRRTQGLLLAAALCCAVGMPAAGFAEDDAPGAGQPPEAGPAEAGGIPAYSVARLKINEGTVKVREGDTGDWVEYTSNMPVPEKSRVSVPDKSDAELQFHGEQWVLVTGGSEVLVREMNKDRSVFQLARGELRFDVSSKDDFGRVEVLVPRGDAVRVDAPGKFWVTVGKDGTGTLVVRRGEAVAAAGRGDVRVKEGEQASLGADVRVSKYAGPADVEEEPPPLSEAENESGVPPSAAYELRDYGDWVYAPEYGYVWRPRVAVDWSPYYYGRWAWVFPWGWTWVAYEPWGWWPYHYGWWSNDPFFGWVWCPFNTFASVRFDFFFGRSRFFCNNVFFRPATVRFVSEGGRLRWTPLRPGERFRERMAFGRGDVRMTRWDRQIGRGTVFMRGRATSGGRWSDWTAVERARVKVMPRGIAVGRGGEVLGRPDARGGAGGREGGFRSNRGGGEFRPDFGRGERMRRGSSRPEGMPPSVGSRGNAPAPRELPGRSRERIAPPREGRGGPVERGGESRGFGAPRYDAVRPGRPQGDAPAPAPREPRSFQPPPRGESFGRGEPPAPRGEPAGRGNFGGGGDFGGRGGARDFGGGRR